MAQIQVLPFAVANLIAAGEVVDRPSSVLKELLENAIDAGATRITAQIRRGGVSLIRVTDNGCGMAPEDLPLSLKRHATSKIRAADDLSGILTLGFRGEALAAISAVCRITLMSKTAAAPSGTMLTAKDGEVLEVAEVGCADGTTVTVEELFADFPARRKFLKKDATEAQASVALVEKVALSRPDISFRMVSDDQVKFETPGNGNVLETLYAVLGREFATRLLAVEGQVGGIGVSGFVGRSDNGRANRGGQNCFLNGRYVHSKTVGAALERAFTSYMAPEKFPVCALYLTVDPHLVDVNVHPAKLEVKFSDERAVFEAVYYSVRRALEEGTERPQAILSDKKRDPARSFLPIGQEKAEQLSMPAFRPAQSFPDRPGMKGTDAPPSARLPQNAAGTTAGEERLTPAFYRPAAASPFPEETLSSPPPALEGGELHSGTPANPGAPVFRIDLSDRRAPSVLPDIPMPRHTGQPQAASSPEPSAPQQAAPAHMPRMAESVGWSVPGPSPAQEKPAPAPAQEESPATGQELPRYRILGLAFRTYILVQLEDELLLIDQHAAHERMLFEDLKRRRDLRTTSQPLLLPLTVPLTGEERMAATTYPQDLAEAGYDFRLTEQGALLTAIPDEITAAGAQDLFLEMLDGLRTGSDAPALTEQMRREKLLYQVACKAAIKGGRDYGEEQTAALVEKLLRMPDITVCPHGRPVAIRLTKHELDRMFDRIK